MKKLDSSASWREREFANMLDAALRKISIAKFKDIATGDGVADDVLRDQIRDQALAVFKAVPSEPPPSVWAKGFSAVAATVKTRGRWLVLLPIIGLAILAWHYVSAAIDASVAGREAQLAKTKTTADKLGYVTIGESNNWVAVKGDPNNAQIRDVLVDNTKDSMTLSLDLGDKKKGAPAFLYLSLYSSDTLSPIFSTMVDLTGYGGGIAPIAVDISEDINASTYLYARIAQRATDTSLSKSTPNINAQPSKVYRIHAYGPNADDSTMDADVYSMSVYLHYPTDAEIGAFKKAAIERVPGYLTLQQVHNIKIEEIDVHAESSP